MSRRSIFEDIEGLEARSGITDVFTTRTGYSKEQTISVYDLISEGEIQGLVHGPASVHLNNDRLMPLEQSTIPGFNLALTVTNSGSSGTLSGNASSLSVGGSAITINPIEGVRSVILRNVWSAPVSAISKAKALGATDANTDVIGYDLTLSSGITGLTSKVQDEPFLVDESTEGTFYLKGYHARLRDETTNESFAGYLLSASDTTHCRWIPLGTLTLGVGPIDVNDPTNYTLEIDSIEPITGVSGTTVTYASTPNAPNGTYKLDIIGAFVTDEGIEVGAATNYDQATAQFRVGTLHQPKMIELGQGAGPGSTYTDALSPAIDLKQNVKFEDTDKYFGLTGVSDSLVTYTPPSNDYARADEVTLIFSYASLYSRRSNGSTVQGYAVYELVAEIDGTEHIIHGNLVHTASSEVPIVFEETINLQKFKPFESFQIIIRRKHPDSGRYTDQFGVLGGEDDKGEHLQFTSGQIAGVVLSIKSSFNYPLSAYAGVTFSSTQFSNMPQRSYHVRGMKVKVPSNYVTREESTTNVASYFRNVSSGTIESTYQEWDGNFREEKVYTNNPAWVFYDLVTHNRYGLGDWISEDQIDKYSLYRIARYCDELVDDGEGNLEPRFTCNLYIAAAEDSYKVLKDLATVFTGILYWIDGQATLVPDVAKDPVYSFSKSNVIDGIFNYESTGSKTRPNQYIISYNDPERDYSLRPVVVEDREDIVSTGQVRVEEAVAFGCTSEAQAVRFGRWKLWTAKHQTELVSFSTHIEGRFLMPGDVVRIQDADKYALQYSGRIPGSSSPTTTSVPLDRSITLNATSEYHLSVVIVEPAAFLAQDGPVVINSVTYNRGDRVPEAYVGGVLTTLTSEIDALNATETSSEDDPIILDWNNTTRVETSVVDDSNGTFSTLTLQTALSAAPDTGTVWAIREFDSDAAFVEGTSKDYKILTISETSKGIADIVAVEHFNEKWDAIDDDINIAPWDEVNPLYISRYAESTLGAAEGFFATAYPNYANNTYEVLLSWIPPVYQPDSDKSVYITHPQLGGFELEHTIANGEQTPKLTFSPTTKAYRFTEVPPGEYYFKLKSITSRGKKTAPATARIELDKLADNPTVRGPQGVPIGGRSDTPIELTSTADTIGFAELEWTYNSPQAPFSPVTNEESGAASYTQDISGIVSEDFSTKSEVEKILDSYYLLWDYSDATDRLKLLRWYTNGFEDSDVPFWYNAGTGIDRSDEINAANTPDDETIRDQLTSVGTFSTLSAGSNTVLGSGTTWLTDLETGDVVRFSEEKYARVVYINSDTSFVIDRVWATSTSSGTLYRSFQVDEANDAIIARVWKDDSDGYQFAEFLTVDPGTAYDAFVNAAAALTDAHGVIESYIQDEAPSALSPSATPAGGVATGQADSGSNATTLIDAAATFTSDVAVGDVVRNLDDANAGTYAHAKVLAVVDDYTLTLAALTGGSANSFTAGDNYDVVDFRVGDVWLDSNSIDPKYDNWRWEDTTGNGVGDQWVGPNNSDIVGRSMAEALRSMNDAAIALATEDGIVKTWAQDEQPEGYTASDGDAEAHGQDNEGHTTILECLTADFVANTSVGDFVRNTTDGSTASVVEILSTTQILHSALVGGTDNDWDSGDKFEVGGPAFGDFWIETDNENKLWRYDGSNWDEYDVNNARATADSALGAASDLEMFTIYTQDAKPTGGTYAVGDIWLDTDAGDGVPPFTYDMIYRYQETSTEGVYDFEAEPTDILGRTAVDTFNAESDAALAAALKDGRITSWAEDDEPVAKVTSGSVDSLDEEGRELADTSNNFVSAGVSVGDFIDNITDGSSAQVLAVTTNRLVTTKLAGGSDNTWAVNDDYEIAAPHEGDYWIDTNDSDRLYRHNGSNWVDYDIYESRTTADQALVDAAEALAEMEIYVDSSEPSTSGKTDGDIWIDTSVGNGAPPYTYDMINRFSDSADDWVAGPSDLIGRAHVDVLNGLKQSEIEQALLFDQKIRSWAQNDEPGAAITGTAAATDTTGTVLTGSGTTFTSDVSEGDKVENTTDGSFAFVVQVVSDTVITHTPLQGGGSNDWVSGESYALGGPSVGDYWVDTNNNNELTRFDGTNWVYQDPNDAAADAAQAISDAANALAASGGKIIISVQGTAPTGVTAGDVWLDNTNYPPYRYSMINRWDGDSWENDDDYIIGQLAVDQLNNQLDIAVSASLADGRILTWAQNDAPAVVSSGTIDTTDTTGKKVIDLSADFISDGVSTGDFIDNVTDGSSAQILGVVDLNTLITTPLLGVGSDNQWANGDSYEIGGPHEGDYWMDTDEDNKVYRHDGSNWQDLQDDSIAAAQADADTAIDDAAAALAAAGGTITVEFASSAPSTVGKNKGDLWIDNSNYPPYTDSMINRFDGSNWTSDSTHVIGTELVLSLNNQDMASVAASVSDGRVVTSAGPIEPSYIKSGTSSSTGSENVLVTTSGSFLSGLSVGDIVDNYDDGSSAQITGFDTNNRLIHTKLAGGTNNFWTSGDEYRINAPHEGDFWIDTNYPGSYDNAIFRYNGSNWVDYRDEGIAYAVTTSDDAQTTADSKNTIFTQTTEPSTDVVDDLWIDTNSSPANIVRTYNGVNWVLSDYDGDLQGADGNLSHVDDGGGYYKMDANERSGANDAYTGLIAIDGVIGDIDDGGGYYKTTADQKNGGGYAYLGLNSSGRVSSFMLSSEMASTASTGTRLIIDNDGLRSYVSSNQRFEINTSGWALFEGNTSGPNSNNGAVVGDGSNSGVWGVYGYSDGAGVLGLTDGTGIGVKGILYETGSASGAGVEGQNSQTSTSDIACAIRASGISSSKVALDLNTGDITGDAFFRDAVEVEDTSNATSTSSGALVVAGGVGIGNDCFVDGNLVLMQDTMISSSSSRVALYGASIASGGTSLGIRTTASLTATAVFTLSHKLKIEINGTEYYMGLEEV